MIVLKNNTKIMDSYKYSNSEIEKIADKVIQERLRKNYIVTRTKESYIREIKTHNRFYKLGILRNKTRDTDLEEPISKVKEILYKIFGR